MRKWLRPDWRARLLDLFACFLIPLYTLLFTHDTRWFTTNFSVIAAARTAFSCGGCWWGSICCASCCR